MKKKHVPQLRESDTPVLDCYYYVASPYFVEGEIVHARYVGESEHDSGFTQWFRVDGDERLFIVGNPYMVRSDLETLRETLITWAENELADITDEERLEAKRKGLRARIQRLSEIVAEENSKKV